MNSDQPRTAAGEERERSARDIERGEGEIQCEAKREKRKVKP